MIWIKIKRTNESFSRVDLWVPLMGNDLTDIGSLIPVQIIPMESTLNVSRLVQAGLLIFCAVAEQRNSGKSAKSSEILSNACLYSYFETCFSYWGYLNSQIYVKTSPLKCAKKRSETSRHRLCCEKLSTSDDVKGFAIGSFLERIVVERAKLMMTSVRKTLKTLV